MIRPQVWIPVVLALGLLALGSILLASSPRSGDTESTAVMAAPTAMAPAASAPVAAAVALPPGVDATTAAAATGTDPAAFEALAAEVASEDPERRAAAIRALVDSPTAMALPVLRRVLGNGQEADKQIALDTLQTMAMKHGDADGTVRDAVREVIYHDGDEVITLRAQRTLEIVEAKLSGRSPPPASTR